MGTLLPRRLARLGRGKGREGEGEEVGSLCFTLTDPTQKKETYFLGRRERERRGETTPPSPICDNPVPDLYVLRERDKTKAATSASAAPAAPTSRMLKMERIAFFQTE